MNKLNRILSLCIALLLLCTTGFAYNAGTLTYLGVTPDGVGDNMVVTREILAYSLASVLMPENTFENTAASFTDVDSTNPYSGHIAYVSGRGIMTGYGDGTFNPSKVVTVNEVAKTLVSALGYGLVAEAKGGWPGGYMSVASSLKLFKGADVTGTTLTWASLKAMLLNMLECPSPDEVIFTEDGTLGTALKTQKNAETFAEKYLSLYSYEATVTDVDFERYRAKVRIDYADDGAKFVTGEEVNLDISSNVNIAVYRGIPVEITVYDNKEIVDVALRNGYSIKYGVADSVNNSSADVGYSVNSINALTLWDDENDYDFAPGCEFYVDSAPVTSGILNLVDEYIRIVEKEDEIVALSTWTLTYGGKITRTTDSHIYYMEDGVERRIDKMNEITDMTVIIDGEPRSYKELKAGMVFSYNRNVEEKTAVIIATEKRLSDILNGINTSDRTLSLGNISVRYANDVQSTTDGTKYSKGTNALLKLSETDVVVVFDIYGVVRYVESYKMDSDSQDFLAYIIGYKQATSFRGAEIRLACINDDGIPVKDFPVSDKVTYEGSPDVSQVIASAGNPDGSAFYIVEFNAKGEVKEFKNVPRIEGFEDNSSNSYGTFLDDGTPYLGHSGIRMYIPKTTPVISIFDNNGEIEVTRLTYSVLIGKSLDNESTPDAERVKVKLHWYSDDARQDLKMIVMTGPVNKVPNTKKSGIIDRVGRALNADGEDVDSVTIDGVTYALIKDSENQFELGKGMLVEYSESLFKVGEVAITAVFDFSKDFSEWHGISKGKDEFCTGTVTKSSKSRLTISLDKEYVNKGNTYGAGDEFFCYYQPGCKFYGIDSEGELLNLSYQDIVAGDKVAILLNSDKSYGSKAISEVYVRRD